MVRAGTTHQIDVTVPITILSYVTCVYDADHGQKTTITVDKRGRTGGMLVDLSKSEYNIL